jgi:hypothetical protein
VTLRLFAIAALTMATPAAAGVHAVYRITDEPQPLVVDVADNGDASFMQVDGEIRVVVTGGQAFAVGEGDNGVEVVRLVDVAEAVKRTGAPALELGTTEIEALATTIDIRAIEIGPRSVRGVAGTAYRLTAGPGVRLDGEDSLIATKAAELRPIGHAVEVVLAGCGGVLTLFDRIGPDYARWMRMFGKLAALGTPLEWKGLYELVSVETRRVPPETITLPSAPIGIDALVKRIREMTPGT